MYLFAIIGTTIILVLMVAYIATSPNIDDVDDYESDRDWSDDAEDDGDK